MDYQEAIYCMKVMTDEEVCEDCNYYQLCDHTKQADMDRIAISAMHELKLYKDGKLCLIPESVYSKQCTELDAYKQLGTLEEIKNALEKQVPKKAIRVQTKYRSPCRCPHCEAEISEVHFINECKDKITWCWYCGCAIDWSEEDEQ